MTKAINKDLELKIFNRLYSGELDSLAKDIEKKIQSGTKTWLSCLNVFSYALCKSDSVFFRSLQECQYMVADGIGVSIASKIVGLVGIHRITGFDLFSAVNNLSNRNGLKVFFLGSTDEVLDAIISRYKKDYPKTRIVGSYSPPFYDEFPEFERQNICRRINEAAPDILWVGLSAPKQETMIAKIYGEADFGFAAGIGAVFDFYSGNIKRAPMLIQKCGLEWAYRFILNPRKMIVRVRTIPSFCGLFGTLMVRKIFCK